MNLTILKKRMQCLNCGSSMAENSENAGNSDNNDFVMPEPVGIDSLSSVDKQAMVEDWLNPEQNTDNNIAPQVQQQKQAASDCPCPGTSAPSCQVRAGKRKSRDADKTGAAAAAQGSQNT